MVVSQTPCALGEASELSDEPAEWDGETVILRKQTFLAEGAIATRAVPARCLGKGRQWLRGCAPQQWQCVH